MTLNISSRKFSLTINGVNRTSEFSSIDLAQPSTLERRDAPITGTITLIFNPLRYNEFITIGNPTIAANWAVGALIIFQIANDTGTLVNNLLSGGQLYILKEPSPPSVGFDIGTLQLEVGDILAYQSQRTPDRDVSGVPIGTSVDRDEIVRKVLVDAGINSFSIPDLPYPFNTPVQKNGGTPIKLAGDLVGAVKHVLYCTSAGIAVAAPIDLNAAPIATLTVGKDESKFDPVDGSSIPTVTNLTIAGVAEEPDSGNYPILVITPQQYEYAIPNSSNRVVLTVSRNTLQITSENYSVEVGEFGFVFSRLVGGQATLGVTPLVAAEIKEELTNFDSLNRLSQKITRKYLRALDGSSGLPSSLFFEIERTIVDYTYTDGYPSIIRTTVYTGSLPISGNIATLYSQSRTTVAYKPNLPYWNQITSVENFGTNFDGVSGSVMRSITANGVTYQAFTTGDSRLPSNFGNAVRTPKTANDGSTRPPAIIYSEKSKTRNREITAIVNAIPLAGVPSKDKLAPITVDWLVSNAHALEYGQLEIVLMNARKQCRFMITALTDQLLVLRPRCRIDIIFNGILYRCLADAIAYSQNLTSCTIGFMCDVISTSPAATPETIYKPVLPVNSLWCNAIADPATNLIDAGLSLDIIPAQAEPAISSVVISVEVGATIAAQASPATSILAINVEISTSIAAQASPATSSISINVGNQVAITAQADAATASITIPNGDNDAIVVIAAIEATGVTLSSGQKTAITNRIVAAKSDGVWSKWVAYYGFVGGTANAHAINWKNPSLYNIGWSGGITHNAYGVKGDASSGYGDTGLNTNAAGLMANIGMGFYLTDNKGVVLSDDSGSNTSIFAGISLYNGKISYYGGAASGEIDGTVSNSGNKQYISGSRLSGIITSYSNGSIAESFSSSHATTPNINLYLFNYNNSGSLGGRPSSVRMGSFVVNTGLTDAEETTNYTSELAFQTALSRN